MTATAGAPGLEGPRPAPARWARNAVFGAIGTTIVLGWIGDALWASLVDRSPLALIALNAKPRYLILTVNELEPWAFYPFALARLMVSKPLVWLVGSWYGPRAMTWAEQRTERGGRIVRWMERHFARFGWLIVLVTSNNVVCLLAGSSGFPLGWFLLLAALGTLARLWLIDLLGAAFTEPIDRFVGWVTDHRPAVVAVSVTVVLVGIWWERRHGGSELDEFADLEHEMEGEIEAAEHERGAP